MLNIESDLLTALPEVTMLFMAMLILISGLFTNKSNQIVLYLLAQATLIVTTYLLCHTHTTAVAFAFSGLFVDDPLSDTLKVMTTIGGIIMLVYTRDYLQVRNLLKGEYYALILFSMLGMMVMISGQNLLTIYMGLELLSLCLYALVAMDRDNANATEAAMKYFVLGALASGMLLYGMSMIYGMTGSLDITNIASVINESNVKNPVLILGLVFVVAGLAFKFGAVPFHMWVPDVYQGSPTAITMLIGSIPKFAAFAMALRILAQGLQPMNHDWQDMLLIMAVMSISIGNFAAIAQTNLKRMLAYSTISHIGFLLLGLLSGNLNGYISSMFYISAYVLMTLAGFGMILLLSRQGFEAEQLDDLKGLNKRSPWLAFMMLITMFSMAGIPPTIGFYAKFTVLQAALQAGHVLLVIFAVLMAVIGAFYYLRIVRLMYFDAPIDSHPINASPDVKVMISINSILLLLFGLLPQSLMMVCAYAVARSLQ